MRRKAEAGSPGDGNRRRRLPSPIGLADALAAFAELRPSDRASREKIVALLGFGWAEPRAEEIGRDERALAAGGVELSSGEEEPERASAERELEYLRLDSAEERPEKRSIRKVYLSSTVLDRATFQAARAAIRGLGIAYVRRDPASGSMQDPLRALRASDCYVGILGWRYGKLIGGKKRSASELEYEEARRLGLPCLLFLAEAKEPTESARRDADLARIEAFRKRWRREHTVGFFDSPQRLEALLKVALRRLLGEDAVPSWWSAALAHPLPRSSDPARPSSILPLLAPRRSRAILSRALSAPEALGPVDLHQAIDAIASKRPLSFVPREEVWTVRRGVQVLLDRSPANAPFRGDQEQVVDELLRLIPPDRLETIEFRVHPEVRDVKERRTGYRGPYRPPPRGVPILILSTLGMGPSPPASGSVDASLWLRLARRLAVRDSRTVALVPVRRSLWSPSLKRHLHLVPWDRRTRIVDVLRERR